MGHGLILPEYEWNSKKYFQNASPESVKKALENGADIHAVRIDILTPGWTPIHHAARYSPYPEIIKILIDRGADLEILDQNNWTPLCLTTFRLNSKMIDLFFNIGANRNIKDPDGCDLLHLTCLYGSLNVMKFLVRHGFDVNSKNEEGLSPLHFALRNNKYSHILVPALVELNADVNAKTENGWSIIHEAASLEKDDVETFIYLISKGANIHVITKEGDSPLHWACIYGNTKIIQVLIEMGADHQTVNKDGETPLDLLRRTCHFNEEAEKILIKASTPQTRLII